MSKNEAPKLTAAVENISPEVAGRLLGTMERNRMQRRAKINQFARAMIAGEWKLNGEPIIIGKDGKLRDGQHRLQAVQAAKITVPMLVVRGVTPDAMNTIDTGTSRSYGDVLTLRTGDSYGGQIAAIARRWWLYENTEDFATFAVTLSHTELDHIVAQHPGISIAAHRAHNSKFKRWLQASSFGFAYNYLYEKEDVAGPEIAELFFTALETGAELKEQNPILVLRERLMSAERLTARESLALTIKAFNLWMEGLEVKVLVFQASEKFPRFGITPKSARRGRRIRMKANGIELPSDIESVAAAKAVATVKEALSKNASQ